MIKEETQYKIKPVAAFLVPTKRKNMKDFEVINKTGRQKSEGVDLTSEPARLLYEYDKLSAKSLRKEDNSNDMSL